MHFRTYAKPLCRDDEIAYHNTRYLRLASYFEAATSPQLHRALRDIYLRADIWLRFRGTLLLRISRDIAL